jgi:two-component system, OmpR family, sensor histidine kinase ArlS
MKAQIEVMLMQERSKEEYIETLQSIGEDIDRFMQLIFSLSELAKANVDTIGNNRASVPVIEIVAESRADLLRSKSRYRINLQITSLPENDHENYVIGNAALLKSAIENLIENACKFSPDQHCQVVVSFEPGNIIIKVIDEGIGIAANEIAHIFEPFYRANDTRGISGHGIGLSLVKKIIELHNGTIRAESEISKGTQMIVTLPNTENNV